MQKLTEHEVINLGGEGEHQIEVEYIDSSDIFREGIHHLSLAPIESEIEQAILSRGTISNETSAWIILTVSSFVEPVYINLVGGCKEIVEIRLPCGTNIIDKFFAE